MKRIYTYKTKTGAQRKKLTHRADFVHPVKQLYANLYNKLDDVLERLFPSPARDLINAFKDAPSPKDISKQEFKWNLKKAPAMKTRQGGAPKYAGKFIKKTIFG
jgi:hypothetical protein